MLQRSSFLLAATAVLAACAEPTATLPVASNVQAASGWMEPGGEPATVRLGGFSKSPVIAMGLRHGFFAAEDLTIADSLTPSSPTIFRKLRDGQWDIILTQIDNVFNYRYNRNNPLSPAPDVDGRFDPVAIGGTDWGNGASLMARPGFTFDSIRGKNVIVDSPNSGFAFVLYGILRNAGLERGRDYNIVVTGGTPGRFADLRKGSTDIGVDLDGNKLPAGTPVAATILNAGFQFRAQAVGMAMLGNIPDAVDPFMGGSIVAKRTWLDGHEDIAIRFLRAYKQAQLYVLDPANKDEVMAWLLNDSGNAFVAENTYRVLTTVGEGLIPDASIDTKGLYGTASLRASFPGGFQEEQNLSWLVTPASGMYDLSYWRRASAPRGQ